MSDVMRILQDLEREARGGEDGPHAYSLVLHLKSGRELECDAFAVKQSSYIKVDELVSRETGERRIALVPFSSIEYVTPIWL